MPNKFIVFVLIWLCAMTPCLLTIGSARPGQRSLVLILDVTESMSTDLAEIQQGFKKMFNKISSLSDNPIYNYIFVPFREENGTKETGPILVTDDKEEIISALEAVHIHGGGDCPEPSISAIIDGLKLALPHSYVLVFTDASAKDFWLEHDAEELLQRKQATMSILLTGYCDNKRNEKYKVFERLTQMSNGQVYDIRSDGIQLILDDVSAKLESNHVLLTSQYASRADDSIWDFSVDETINKLELMVCGENAKVLIVHPYGRFADDATETVISTNVKGYTIDKPSNGTWQINVASKSAHSVRITADSSLSFSFGFSARPVQPPNYMLDTQFFPLNRTQNILTIVSSKKVNLTEVHLLFMDSQLKPIVLPLNEEKALNAAEYFYETESFDPPEKSFKISVNGYNENGIQINRTISTTLQKLDGQPPDVFLNETTWNVNEGADLILNCSASSAVPFEVSIQYGQKLLKKESQSNASSKNISHRIESAVLEDSGQYACIASNVFGSSNKSVNVKVTWVPSSVVVKKAFTVTIPKVEYVGKENQSQFEIPCSVSLEPTSTLNINWHFNGTKIDIDDNIYKLAGNNLVISNLTKEHTGNYTCVAVENNETKSVSTQLTVQYAPILSESDNEEIYVEYADSLSLNCSGNGLPPVQSQWKLPNGTEIDKSNLPLQIVNFETSDEGMYECLLDNGIEPAAVRRVTLRPKQ